MLQEGSRWGIEGDLRKDGIVKGVGERSAAREQRVKCVVTVHGVILESEVQNDKAPSEAA